MNNFEIEIKKWHNLQRANVEINEYIADCKNQGIEIVEVASHISENEKCLSYIFVFKLKWNGDKPRKKKWSDERW